MRKYRQPVFVSLRTRNNSISYHSTLERINTYGDFIFQRTAGEVSKVFVLGLRSNKNELMSSNLPFLEFISVLSFRFIALVLSSNKMNWSKNKKHFLAVSADLKFDLVFALILRYLCNFKIQISIHGDVFPNQNRFVLSVLRKALFRFSVPRVDSFRTVSTYLKEWLINDYQVNPKKIVISHVPIRVPETDVSANRPHTLCFIGRFHEERGVEEWIQIARLVLANAPNTRLLLIGNGPLLNSTVSELESIAISGITATGWVNQNALDSLWTEVKVVLSCAPSEGFGMTIREALCNGAIVVAKNSRGAHEASLSFDKGLFLYSNIGDAVSKTLKALSTNLSVSEVQAIRSVMRDSNEGALHRVADSWSPLINPAL